MNTGADSSRRSRVAAVRVQRAAARFASHYSINPIEQIPGGVEFCERRIERWWGESRSTAKLIVNECTRGQSLPFILGATENGRLCGTVMACEANADVSVEHRPWLMLLYVRSDARRRGIGRALVNEAICRLKRLGNPAVYIDTTTASTFFASLGWKRVGSREWRGETTEIFEWRFSEVESQDTRRAVRARK